MVESVSWTLGFRGQANRGWVLGLERGNRRVCSAVPGAEPWCCAGGRGGRQAGPPASAAGPEPFDYADGLCRDLGRARLR